MAEENSSEIVKEQSESLAAKNLAVLGDGPIFFQNQMYEHAVEATKGWTSLNQAIVGKVCEAIMATSPSEAGHDIAALMQLIKAAQTTPPSSP